MKTNLDRLVGRVALISAISLIVGAVVVATVLARPTWRPRFLSVLASSAVYKVGQRVDLQPEVYQTSPFTLLYFARDSCAACFEATPLVSEAFTSIRESPIGATVRSVLVPAGEEPSAALASRLGLEPASVFTLPVTAQQQLRLRAVPTVLLVNQSGRILLVVESLDHLRAVRLGTRVRQLVAGGR